MGQVTSDPCRMLKLCWQHRAAAARLVTSMVITMSAADGDACALSHCPNWHMRKEGPLDDLTRRGKRRVNGWNSR